MTYMTHVAPEVMHEWLAEARRDAEQFRVRRRPDLVRQGRRNRRSRERGAEAAAGALLS